MIFKTYQYITFEEAARPLIRWLNENCSPESKVIVDISRAELLEGDGAFQTDDYVKD